MINVLVDTREKKFWDFTFLDDINIKKQKLDYGDYTTENLKDILVIERKSSTSELAVNVTDSYDKVRFNKELSIMQQKFQHRYVICEFSEKLIYQFPKNSGLPKKVMASISFTGMQLRKIISKVQEKYDIPFIFCENREEAEMVAYNIISSLEKKHARDLSSRGQ